MEEKVEEVFSDEKKEGRWERFKKELSEMGETLKKGSLVAIGEISKVPIVVLNLIVPFLSLYAFKMLWKNPLTIESLISALKSGNLLEIFAVLLLAFSVISILLDLFYFLRDIIPSFIAMLSFLSGAIILFSGILLGITTLDIFHSSPLIIIGVISLAISYILAKQQKITTIAEKLKWLA